MHRMFRILRAIVVLLVAALGILALVISHDSACAPAADPGASPARMLAATYSCYGSPDVLRLVHVDKPAVGDDQVRVRVRAAALNPLDWHFMRGTPYVMRLSSGIGAPTDTRLGVDFAGVVEAVGKDVRKFKPGDEVFGGADGAFAEYVSVREGRALARKPARLTFGQAAAINIAGVTALQALRDEGSLQAGQKVLVNGASGGVGTFAVQIAKSFGAEVTGVCSSRNVELVRSLGADHVVDYTREDFTEGGERYDLVVDMVGNRGLLEMKSILKPDGRLVIVGGPEGNWVGPMSGAIKAIFVSPFVKQDMGMMLAHQSADDLRFLGELVDAGKLTPVIDRSYPFAETADAIRYLELGRARGKVVISFEPADAP